MNSSPLKRKIYSYLGFHNVFPDERTDGLIGTCLKELEEHSRFKYAYARYLETRHEFLKKEPYLSFLSGSRAYCLSVMTLGADTDNYLRRLAAVDVSKAVVADACASALLEEKSDEFEDRTFGGGRTYRFCPGYGGSDMKDIRFIFEAVRPKIGVQLLESGMMVPQKSMAGIIGIGGSAKKSCGECMLKGSCSFLREGVRCYDSEKK